MPIRNPFARRPGLVINDENARPGSESSNTDVAHPGFERVDTVGSKASSALSVRSAKSQDNGEYKMSVVNDSGVYLPPSPVEKEAAWPKRYLSRQSSESKSRDGGEIEHFSISRESFDSYRRSFDITARSPITLPDPAPRQSLDSHSARFPRTRLPARHARSALAERRLPEEAAFEDVGLNDENRNPNPNPAPAKKRMGFFSKFGSEEHPQTPAPSGEQQHQGIASRFLPGRKRGQSIGQGAELGVMPLGERPKVVEEEVQA